MKSNKIPFQLIFVAWLIPTMEKLFPWLAKRLFVHYFFTPARFRYPEQEEGMLKKAKQFTIDYQGTSVQAYEWGQGTPILFVHGWMGRGTQFRKFIGPFNKAGYQVISFDATAHGQSAGKKSHLLDYIGIIEQLSTLYHFKMIVGHSLGGAAALHAIINGVPTKELVMIGSPAIAYDIVNAFKIKYRASAASVNYFNQYIVNKYGKTFEEYSASHVVPLLPKDVNLMLIHDEDDREVDIRNPLAILERYPEAVLKTTKELGHTRILKDEQVVKWCLERVTDPCKDTVPIA